MTDLTLKRRAARAPGFCLPRRPVALKRYGAALLLFLATLAAWQWGVPALGVPPFVLPTPTAVLAELLNPAANIAYHSGITAVRALGGFALGALLGALLAVAFVFARPLEDALYPWVIVLQTVPLVAISPLIVFWLGNGSLSRIVMAALFAFFPVLVNATRGLRHTSREHAELLRSLNASGWQQLRLLRLPASLPFLFTGLKIAAGLAAIGALVAEFAGANNGLGFVITVSTYHLETARTFAAVVAASLLGLGLHLALVLLERRVVFWHDGT
ncbi:MAG: ABC transporter permease [Chloroflexaceae bacterium]|nr:ABC transporter permease [Chloroflexaceae bacterium]